MTRPILRDNCHHAYDDCHTSPLDRVHTCVAVNEVSNMYLKSQLIHRGLYKVQLPSLGLLVVPRAVPSRSSIKLSIEVPSYTVLTTFQGRVTYSSPLFHYYAGHSQRESTPACLLRGPRKAGLPSAEGRDDTDSDVRQCPMRRSQ